MIVINLEGGLGNQCFMQAFGLTYAIKHNLDYCVYTKVNNPHIYDKGVYNLSAYRFPGINYCDEPPILPVFNEPHFHFADLPKMDNVCFSGFWQSFRYIEEYRKDVINAFGFGDIKTKEGICACHIRRSDYLQYPFHHPVVTPVYLTKAIIYMVGKGYKKFKVFSDGMEWAKKFFGNEMLFGDLEFEYSEGKTELEDLMEMASCSSIVTANSTFSAWAAYINPNPDKIVVQPKEWFGSALNHNTVDLYLPNSIIL